MHEAQACFVGGGNMASAILAAPGAKAAWEPARTWVADPVAAVRDRLAAAGLRTVATPAELPPAPLVFLCTKPQDMEAACQDLLTGQALAATPVCISIAAGITSAALQNWLGTDRLIRTMPNTPLLVGKGCTFGHTDLPTDLCPDAMQVAAVFGSCGAFHWVSEEHLLDAATALSGSGPAYGYLVIEAMATAGTEMGLPPQAALDAAVATIAGAAAMVAGSDDGPAVLRERVSSKGGTTVAALAVLQERGFAEALKEAMAAARERATEIGRDN